jgi:peptide/nickel transport system permease protein
MPEQDTRKEPRQGRVGFLAGCVMLLALLAAGTLAPWIAPHSPEEQYLSKRLRGPSAEFPLGTDSLGRCVASRIIHGIRPTLGLACSVTVGSVLLGLAVGLTAVLARPLDGPLMRFTDCFFSFPSMVLVLVLVGILGPSTGSIALALILPGWPKYARVARNTALGISRRTYVEATRTLGANRWYLVRRCYLPGLMEPLGAIATIGMGQKIVSIAGLGMLGLGVPPPTPEWGGMLQKGLPVLTIAPHIALSAGGSIVLATLAFTLAGDGLRDLAVMNRPDGEELWLK